MNDAAQILNTVVMISLTTVQMGTNRLTGTRLDPARIAAGQAFLNLRQCFSLAAAF